MISRREFLAIAAAAIAGALTAGIVKAEKPVPVEDIQTVPLGARTIVDYSAGEDVHTIIPVTFMNWPGDPHPRTARPGTIPLWVALGSIVKEKDNGCT